MDSISSFTITTTTLPNIEFYINTEDQKKNLYATQTFILILINTNFWELKLSLSRSNYTIIKPIYRNSSLQMLHYEHILILQNLLKFEVLHKSDHTRKFVYEQILSDRYKGKIMDDYKIQTNAIKQIFG